MILDVSSILAVAGESKSFSVTIQEDAFDYDKTICDIISPILVSGKISNIGGAFKLHLDFETKIRVNCARCTKVLERDFSFSTDETLRINEENDDNVKLTGNSFDITNLLSSVFISNVDFKYLCSDDCKGLCPICGKDLNQGSCECKDDEIDPRFAVLKKLLEEK